MKSKLRKFLASAFFFTTTLGLIGCSSGIIRKAQRTDGFLDFVAALGGSSVEDALPVERVSNSQGQIATAHVRAFVDGFYVSGLVRKQSLVDPPPWSRVDVILLDAKQNVVESVTTRYMPRDIPTRLRGGFPQSQYIARLNTLKPPAGSTVRVVFDSKPEPQCDSESCQVEFCIRRLPCAWNGTAGLVRR